MNFYALSALIAAVFIAVITLFVLGSASDKRVAAFFTVVNLAIEAWVIGCFIESFASAKWALPADILLYLGAAFAPTLFLHFVLDFAALSKRFRLFLIFNYGCSFLFSLFNLIPRARHNFILRVAHPFPYRFIAQPGPLFTLFILWYLIPVSFLLYRLWVGGKDAKSSHRRLQYQYFLIAALALAFAGAMYFGLVLSIAMPPIDNLFTIGYGILMSYAILNYQLLDIRVIIRKTLIYSVVSALLLALYVGLIHVLIHSFEGVLSGASLVSSAVAAGIIAILFHPLQTRLQRWIDRRFPRESLDQSMLREATGTFVHEIKRPLANISLPAQLALQDIEALHPHTPVSEDVLTKLKDRLQYIIRESIEAGHKIEAIRGLASHRSPTQEPVDLRIVTSQVIQAERSRIACDQIQLTTDIGESLFTVVGDDRQLQIAIGNVLKNAIDALAKLPSGQARELRVALHKTVDTMVLDIEDSGPGISAADLPRLFEPWFSTKGSHGMGIGLYLTKEILKLHGATIEAHNRTPIGCTFKIVFPLKLISQ